MRKKIFAVVTALALGAVTMSTGAMAFGHGAHIPAAWSVAISLAQRAPAASEVRTGTAAAVIGAVAPRNRNWRGPGAVGFAVGSAWVR